MNPIAIYESVMGAARVAQSIAGFLGITFPTHRPDADELPAGCQWLDFTPDAGVLHVYDPGDEPRIDWRGEILATMEDNFPCGMWNFATQDFFPLGAISREGLCVFMPPSKYPASIPEWRTFAEKEYGMAQIQSAVSAELAERGESWERHAEMMRIYRINAVSQGVAGGASWPGKLHDATWYATREGKAVATASALSLVGLAAAAFPVWRVLK